MKTIMLSLELMTVAVGEPPQAPPVREPAQAPTVRQPSYAAFLSRVERGEVLTMAVNMDSPNAVRCDDAKKYGIADGLYSCWFDGTESKMQRIERPAPNAGTPAYNPATRYYSPVWNREEYCPPGKL